MSEEVTFERFYDVCGSDRQTIKEYGDRVEQAKLKGGVATIDALRMILCDVANEDRAVQALVHQQVRFAVPDSKGDEESLLALVESGVMPPALAHQDPPRRMSDRGVLRLERVVADRHADVDSRCWALELLIDARGNGVALRWINDRSDPIQSCAAPVAIKEMSVVERHEVLTHPGHPLHLELLLNEPVTEETRGPLCDIVSDAGASPLARVRAIDQLNSSTGPAIFDCLAPLLQPEKWFVFNGRHSVKIVLDSLFVVDHRRTKELATILDTTGIVDQELRQAVEDTRLWVRTFDPDAPYYDADDPPEGDE